MMHVTAITILGAILLISALESVAAGRGPVIYDNLGPGDDFDHGFAWGFGTDPFFDPPVWDQTIYGVPFTSPINSALDTILIPVGLFSGANILDVELRTDDGGLPGQVLETVQLVDRMPDLFSPSLVTVYSALHPALQANTTYWVTIDTPDSTTFGGWFVTSTFEIGPWAESDYGLGWYLLNGLVLQGLKVTAVPEPSTLFAATLGSFGLLGLLHARKRSRRRLATPPADPSAQGVAPMS